jgi:glutaredoxin-dependent peroxiredoxin
MAAKSALQENPHATPAFLTRFALQPSPLANHQHFICLLASFYSEAFSMSVQIKVGYKAPDLSLPDTDSKMRRLSEFLGKKVVLAFFVTAFTSTCTMEACTFRDSMSKLIDLEAQVIGISINDIQSNREFAEDNRLPFPVLSDSNHEVTKAYGLEQLETTEQGYPVLKRSIFIIDKQGIVRYAWVAEHSFDEPNYDEIQRKLEKI